MMGSTGKTGTNHYTYTNALASPVEHSRKKANTTKTADSFISSALIVIPDGAGDCLDRSSRRLIKEILRAFSIRLQLTYKGLSL